MPERWEKILNAGSIDDFVFVHLALYGVNINRICVDRVNEYYAELAEDAKKAGFVNATQDHVANIGEEFVDKARKGKLPHALDDYRQYNRLIQENFPVQKSMHIASDSLHILAFFLLTLIIGIFNLMTIWLQPMTQYAFVVRTMTPAMCFQDTLYLNGSADDICHA